jgi:hypothetical protein
LSFQAPVAAHVSGIARLAREFSNDPLTGLAQGLYHRLERGVVAAWRENGAPSTFGITLLRECQQSLQVGTKSRGWARAPKHPPDVIIAPAIGDCLTMTGDVGAKHGSGVIAITPELSYIKV